MKFTPSSNEERKSLTAWKLKNFIARKILPKFYNLRKKMGEQIKYKHRPPYKLNSDVAIVSFCWRFCCICREENEVGTYAWEMGKTSQQ